MKYSGFQLEEPEGHSKSVYIIGNLLWAEMTSFHQHFSLYNVKQLRLSLRDTPSHQLMGGGHVDLQNRGAQQTL